MTATLLPTVDSASGLQARASAPPSPTRSIVVAVDGSPASIEALSWTHDRLIEPGNAVCVVTAFQPLYVAADASAKIGGLHESAECARTAAELAIRSVFGPDEPGHIVEHVVALGNIDALIDRQSADADLIVLGSRSRRRLFDRFRPSAASRVTRWASCPVISVRSRTDEHSWRDDQTRTDESTS
jgi:nucleotide-binding universal stress UspA family protein